MTQSVKQNVLENKFEKIQMFKKNHLEQKIRKKKRKVFLCVCHF